MPQHVKNDREFLSTSEACEKTGLSPRYIQRLLQEGRLEGFKASTIWFVYEDSLAAFVAQPRKRGPKGSHNKPESARVSPPPKTKHVEETPTDTGGYSGDAKGQEVQKTK